MPALYYPFHLCHEYTLQQLLKTHETVHFRDFMALQLTPLMGTTAFPDRMGDYYPQLLESGRVVQGYLVSGPLNPEMTESVNRDLADSHWRSIFHQSLQQDHRFQRGLFDVSLPSQLENPSSKETTLFSGLLRPRWVETFFTIQEVQRLSRLAPYSEDHPAFEYGWALIKTAAALRYTIRLCEEFVLVAATDSNSHFRLLARTCDREGIELSNYCVSREGY